MQLLPCWFIVANIMSFRKRRMLRRRLLLFVLFRGVPLPGQVQLVCMPEWIILPSKLFVSDDLSRV